MLVVASSGSTGAPPRRLAERFPRTKTVGTPADARSAERCSRATSGASSANFVRGQGFHWGATLRQRSMGDSSMRMPTSRCWNVFYVMGRRSRSSHVRRSLDELDVTFCFAQRGRTDTGRGAKIVNGGARHLELGPNAIDYADSRSILARCLAASRVPSAVEQMKVTAVREAVSSLLGYVYDHWPLVSRSAQRGAGEDAGSLADALDALKSRRQTRNPA